MRNKHYFFLKRLMAFIVLVIIICIFTFIKFDFNISRGFKFKNHVDRVLSNSEVNQIIDENNINVLNTQTIYNFTTLIIYGDLYKRGYYEVYVNSDDTILAKDVQGIGYWNNPKQIELDGGKTTGEYPFEIMYIFDDDFLTKCDKIKIIGSKKTFEINGVNKKAYAIETKDLGVIRNIIAYNINQDIIYEY